MKNKIESKYYMDNERYNKIVKCTLKGIVCNYIDSYVLVKNINKVN